ncbi:MAG: hypothetical protein ACRDJ9_23570, partial [Dehalococcoidia bacterium]
VLNAREHVQEAAIIADAGRAGAITIATAMAGRGTDIRLQPDLEERLIERALTEVRRRVRQGPLTVVCASARVTELMRGAIEKEPALQLMPTRRHNALVVSLAPSPLAGEGRGEGESEAAAKVLTRASRTDNAPPHPSPLPSGERGPYAAEAPLFVALGLTVIATEPGAGRRLDDQLRGRAGRQGDEGLGCLYASLEDDTVRFYGEAGVRTRALRALRERPLLEGRAAERVIAEAQERAERLHAGQRQQLFKLDDVVEAQRRSFLRAYDAVLVHAAPDAAMRGFIPGAAAGEVSSRPMEPAVLAGWLGEVFAQYGLPPD